MDVHCVGKEALLGTGKAKLTRYDDGLARYRSLKEKFVESKNMCCVRLGVEHVQELRRPAPVFVDG